MKDLHNRIVILFLLLVLSLPATVLAQGKADSSKQFTIDNCVNTFSMDNTIKTGVGYQYWFVDKEFLDGRTLKMSVVAPHKGTHAPHKHAEDEFFFVLEGEAEFHLDGKTKTGSAYTSFYCPANIEHGIRNVGDTELKYLVIKKYMK
jgi:quercetin dioxygenase-like cupin family protein